MSLRASVVYDRRAQDCFGVIGPTRLNYARVIPTVDYAARIVSRILGG